MTAGAVLARLRDAGLAVTVDGLDLVVKPASRLTPELAALARRHKPGLLALLGPSDGVAWRAAAMASQITASGPIPLLVAVPDLSPASGRCWSCGSPVEPESTSGRCGSCALAARQAMGLARLAHEEEPA
jgi:hypothetical protein